MEDKWREAVLSVLANVPNVIVLAESTCEYMNGGCAHARWLLGEHITAYCC